MPLDIAGRFLMAVDRKGRVLWCTPQAGKLLAAAFPGSEAEGFTLPLDVRDRLSFDAPALAPFAVAQVPGGRQAIQVSYVGQMGPDEFLLRLVESAPDGDGHVLKQHFMLTGREAEVLAWIARGKSNRDIGAILGLSPSYR